MVTQTPVEDAAPPPTEPLTKDTKSKRPRLDRATLHLGNSEQAEARLAELGHPLPSRRLPPETATPQLALDVA